MSGITELFELILQGVQAFFGRALWEVVRDCADIGIVALLFYWVLALLKGTRAMQMALGLVLLFITYTVAENTGLITVLTILDRLITYIVLIVVVVFQNDIRRALMRVGSQSFFRSGRTAKETQLIEEVIKAATALAQKRIGALIVFERDASLDEFMERGTELDARVSQELLYSIFIPSFENPMHDGAVVLREGRLYQAGAFLPLAGTADRTLGARHRAALGVTEETDAVVVVVSEERGAVSLCFGGHIVRNLDANALRDALFGLFFRPKSNKKPNSSSSPSPSNSPTDIAEASSKSTQSASKSKSASKSTREHS